MKGLKNVSELMFIVVLMFFFSALASAAPWLGAGTANDPYQIWDPCDLDKLATETTYYSSHFKMMADVNMADYLYTTAVISKDTGTLFTGVFDGNNHIISNLTIDTSGANTDIIGLFGKIDSYSASIQNLGVIDAAITGGNYSSCIGILVGRFAYGTITNCYTSGDITGCDSLGGLVGNRMLGTISRCYTRGSLTGRNIGWLCGGMFGYNYGDLTDCYSNCAVSGNAQLGGLIGASFYGNISRCYAVGSVTGIGSSPDDIGGLFGLQESGNVIDCFWNTETSGQTVSAAGTGKSNSEMMKKATYTNWDFIDTWMIAENQSFPLLRRYSIADLSCDQQVNFYDFAIFADYWLSG